MKKKTQKSKRVIQLGNKVFIRTVTHYLTGRVIEMGKDYAVLEDAAWIVCTERFHDTLKTGALNEVEPCPDVVEVGLGAVVDAHPWNHDLPRAQK